jgi:hypothetical protein
MPPIMFMDPAETYPIVDDLRCRYKTGKCPNPRSRKRNSQLHQLCADHREKANLIQRKFDQTKRRLSLDGSPEKPPAIKRRRIKSPISLESVSPLVPDLQVQELFSPMDACLNYELWSDIPLISTPTENRWSTDVIVDSDYAPRLSLEEIDYLCSALL